jgi:pilus assembly protein CpaE
MKEIQQILVVERRDQIEAEILAALQAVRGRRASTRTCRSLREGIEDSRVQVPDVVVVELGHDVEEVRSFAEEMAAVAPDAAVAVAYGKSAFEDEGAEGDALIRLTRAGVRDFLRRPVSSADLRQLLDRCSRGGGPAPGRIGTLVSFMSNKGGVGKSTIAVNTAVELGRRFPGRVILIDCSLQHGICASMLNMKPDRTISDTARELGRLDETLLRQHAMAHDSGLHVLAAPPGIIAASEIDEKDVSRILGLARRAYDYVVVDTFPTVDAIAICILDMSDRVHVVVQPIVPLVLGAVGMFAALEGLGVPKSSIRVIMNRGVRPFSGELDAVMVGARLGAAVDFVVPFERRLAVALNSGDPHILRYPWRSGFSRAVRSIAESVTELTPGIRARSVTYESEEPPAAGDITVIVPSAPQERKGIA